MSQLYTGNIDLCNGEMLYVCFCGLTNLSADLQAEARAEFAERSVQKLQKEVDRLEGMLFCRLAVMMKFKLNIVSALYSGSILLLKQAITIISISITFKVRKI